MVEATIVYSDMQVNSHLIWHPSLFVAGNHSDDKMSMRSKHGHSNHGMACHIFQNSGFVYEI